MLQNYHNAMKSYQNVIGLDQRNKQAWIGLAICLRDLGHDEEALTSYQNALSIDPNDVSVYLSLGEILCRSLQRYEEVVELCNYVMEIQPSPLFLSLRGECFLGLEEGEKAVADFEALLRENPKDDDGWRRRGEALKLNEEYEYAIDSFNKAIEINPRNREAWESRIDCFYSLDGNYEALLSKMDREIALNPERSSGWYCKGMINLWGLKRYKTGEEFFSKARKLDPSNPTILSSHTCVLAILTRWEEVERNFDMLIQMDAEIDELLFGYVDMALRILGKWEKAVVLYDLCLETLFERDEDKMCGYSSRAIAYLELGKWEEMIRDCEILLALEDGEEDPTPTDQYYSIGILEKATKHCISRGLWFEALKCAAVGAVKSEESEKGLWMSKISKKLLNRFRKEMKEKMGDIMRFLHNLRKIFFVFRGTLFPELRMEMAERAAEDMMNELSLKQIKSVISWGMKKETMEREDDGFWEELGMKERVDYLRSRSSWEDDDEEFEENDFEAKRYNVFINLEE